MKFNKTKNNKIIPILLACLLIVIVVCGIKTSAVGNELHINTLNDFIDFVDKSKTNSFDGWTVYLDSDINIENALTEKHLSVGSTITTTNSNPYPFKGTFDGQGYTISGLRYDPIILKESDAGLFAYTKDATIMNLKVVDCELDCAYRGGIVVGYADHTTIKNVSVRNSKLKIEPANNILNLITNLGFNGGGIVGNLTNNSYMYNCEIVATEVYNNTTMGVGALGGQGLYMGGLAGSVENSLIEYSRVRSGYIDGQLKESVVRNDYDVAVGALTGTAVYSGGIAGQLKDGKVEDCFSTADVSFYCATYVAVGAGNAGYAGGIAGAMYGEKSWIHRSHYAGNIHSKQYNAILVIPIIQNDVGISGIANKTEGSTVFDSYFKRSKSQTSADIKAVGSLDDDYEFSAKNDSTYIDRDFWESHDYDFTNSILRSNGHTDPHYNKWVMDYDLNIPVHGSSVSATFDFPGAGSVEIGATELVNTTVSTDNPTKYAVQGLHPRDDSLNDEGFSATFTANVKSNYQFNGWYKKTNSQTSGVGDVSELNKITHDGSLPISSDAKYTPTDIMDNDLFVACMKANVVFKDLDGNTVLDDNYYYYLQKLADVKSTQVPDGGIFYGWTTIPNVVDGSNKGYSSITSTELNDIINANELYQSGDEVIKAMTLYPVYIGLSTNVLTEFEGYDRDINGNLNNNMDKTQRLEVGKTTVASDDKGVYIDVNGINAEGTYPDGYRFLGWYKKMDETNEVLVSRNPKYYVKDLENVTTYIARFEYRVDYWVKSYKQSSQYGEKIYTSLWQRFNTPFIELMDIDYYRENIIHWGSDWYYHENDDNACGNVRYTSETKIMNHLKAFSHNDDTAGYLDAYSVIVNNDFPNAGNYVENGLIGNLSLTYTPKENYTFQLWTAELDNGIWQQFTKNNSYSTYIISGKHYATAHITADVNFHFKNETITTVQRRFNNNYFTPETPHEYYYPYYYTSKSTGVKVELDPAPSNDDMKVEGYEFLGWIDETKVTKDSYEWNYIYDVEDSYCTSDIEKVKPYLVTAEDVVTQTADLYPVYARYNYSTTTNIHEIGTISGVNLPTLPTASITAINADGTAQVQILASSDTDVVVTGKEDTYHLLSLTVSVDGEEITIPPDKGTTTQFTYTITAGKDYVFKANYSPLVVLYKVGPTADDSEYVIRNSGDLLGIGPNASIVDNSGSYYQFVGWTKNTPNDSYYWKLDSIEDVQLMKFVSEDMAVSQSMILYPTFVKTSIQVNSNIDDKLQNPNSIRYIQRNKAGDIIIKAEDIDNYKFIGWYKDYVDISEKGTLITERYSYQPAYDDLFENITYTAVYVEAVEVHYHNIIGEEIFVSHMQSGERSFVDKAIDDKGKEYEYILDGEAYRAILQSLNSNQEFVSWQWRKSDGQMVDWNDFYNQLITEDMDLYPVLWNVETLDGKGNSDESIAVAIKNKKGNLSVEGILPEKYAESQCTIHVDLLQYSGGVEPSNTPIKDILTTLFIEKGLDDKGNPILVSIDSKLTDNEGNATYYFEGLLKIKKSFDHYQTKQEVVIFKIINDKNKILEIPLDCIDGKGELIIKLPLGNYKIEESSGWSWRYTSTLFGLSQTNTVLLSIENVLDSNSYEVLCENELENKQWFDSSDRVTNEYSKQQEE